MQKDDPEQFGTWLTCIDVIDGKKNLDSLTVSVYSAMTTSPLIGAKKNRYNIMNTVTKDFKKMAGQYAGLAFYGQEFLLKNFLDKTKG